MSSFLLRFRWRALRSLRTGRPPARQRSCRSAGLREEQLVRKFDERCGAKVTTISVCSAKGSPGVTTLACALGAVWPAERRIAVAECDPAGGDLAARFMLSAKRGMTSLILEARHGLATATLELDDHVQIVPGGLEVLTGPTGAGASRTVDAELPDCLVRLAAAAGRRSGPTVGHDLVLDCGRIQLGAVGQAAAIRVSDHVLVVARPTAEAVASTRWIAERLNRSRDTGIVFDRSPEELDSRGSIGIRGLAAPERSDRARVGVAGLVLVGDGPVDPSQAASALGLPLLGVIAEDRAAAAALRGEPALSWRLARSALVASVRQLVEMLIGSSRDSKAREPAQEPSATKRHVPRTKSGRQTSRSGRFPFRSSSRGRAERAIGENLAAPMAALSESLGVSEMDP